MSSAERNLELPRLDIRELRYWGIPIGEVLARRTEINSDEKTQKGLFKASEAMEKSGIIVLDAHVSPFDIIATGIAFGERIQAKKMVAAVSAYDYNYRFLRNGFFERLNALPGVELFPVFRADDVKDKKRNSSYKKALKEGGIRETVMRYYKRTQEVVREPHQFVLVAAYNGANLLGEELSPGVKKLLKDGNPGICSYTVSDQKALKFRTFLSEDLLIFSSETSVSEMHSQILANHQEIIERATARF